MKSQLMNIFLNTSSDDSDDNSYISEEEVNDSDVESVANNDNSCVCINKEQCSCKENNFEDELYLIQSQFQDNMNINVISSDITIS